MNRRVLPYFIIFIIAALDASALTSVEIKNSAIVESGKAVFLKDIAKIENDECNLGDTLILKSIKPGRKKYLFKRALESKLKSDCKINLIMERKVAILGNYSEFTTKEAETKLNIFLNKNQFTKNLAVKKINLIGNRIFATKDYKLLETRLISKDIRIGRNHGYFILKSGNKNRKIRFIAVLDGIKQTPVKKASKKNSALIKRNDDITIAAVSDTLSVTARGKALKSGDMGEIIPVLNKNSGKKIMAEIISSNSVMVRF